jgi:hypothetical protein
MELAGWAEGEARRRLGPVGTRWLHSQAVALRAREIAPVCEPADRALLVAAAFVHDVGYAPELAVSGFHPLDGAYWLQAQGEDRLAALVAHHTGARFEAEALRLGRAIEEFADEASVVSDALTYCDLTTGPTGARITVLQRLGEIEQRYGSASIVVEALRRASESLFAMVERTEMRLGGVSHV